MRGGNTNHSSAALATGVGLRVAKRQHTSRPRRALIATIHPTAETRATIEVPEVAYLTPVGGALKRALDIAIALLVLTLFGPLMGFIAVGIRLCMGGPVIFRQERIGFNGCTFVCFKFRSMVRNADDILRGHLARDPSAAREWQETQKLRNDPRVSFFGNLLRKSSLDELPQLFNVLRGEMSCVGPRPIIPAELGRYGAHARTCFRARPGITGIWQTNGRNRLSYAERIALDHYYVNHWSFWLDMVLLLKTIPAVLRVDNTS
jgi:exopolysaccharide production protein ExoY